MQFDTTPSQSTINHKMANENGEISPPPKKKGQPINDNNIYLLIKDINFHLQISVIVLKRMEGQKDQDFKGYINTNLYSRKLSKVFHWF